MNSQGRCKAAALVFTGLVACLLPGVSAGEEARHVVHLISQRGSAGESRDRTRPDYTRPRLTSAIARHDNDIAFGQEQEGQRVPLPWEVARAVHRVAKKEYERAVEWERKQQAPHWFIKLKELYGPIFRIDAPKGRAAFVFNLVEPPGFSCYSLLVHNPQTKIVTREPPCIYGKWSDGMTEDGFMRRPHISFDDINQDGEPEVVMQERAHNGTVYNAVVLNYFHIGHDLSLKRVLALEAETIADEIEIKPARIIRSLQKLQANQIRILVELQSASPAVHRLKIGEVLLESEGPGSPFVLKSKVAYVDKYESVLITGSEEDESTFVNGGVSFHY